jgi:hypothetical protein
MGSQFVQLPSLGPVVVDELDVDTALSVLDVWLLSWKDQDWRAMAPFSTPIGGDDEIKAKLLKGTFSYRRITSYSEPQFKDGNTDTPEGDVAISFADFDVSVELADGRGTESFVARVIGIGDKWGVNAVSTMKRTTSPPGKASNGEEEDQRPEAQ